jgi:hypothetical protein
VLGGKFVRHPHQQVFLVRVKDADFPATRKLPATFEWKDECYFLDHLNPDIHVLLVIHLQKPASLTIKEGRQMADTLKRTGRIFQQGSQQRSTYQFRYACELVRNGRIGKVQQVLIGLPADPAGGVEPEMPVPPNLNYEMWLGSTPMVYYTEKRVHPQAADLKIRYGRPGWLRCEQFGAGMITG